MNKRNTMESVMPFSGQYSFKKDLRLSGWFIFAAATLVVIEYLLRHHPEWSLSWKVILSLSPLVPCLLYARSWLRFIRGLDEMQRRIQVEVWLFAAMGTVLVETIISVLNAKGVGVLSNHGLGMGGTMVSMVVLWILGTVISNRRYR
jgi:hypothetical protein